MTQLKALYGEDIQPHIEERRESLDTMKEKLLDAIGPINSADDASNAMTVLTHALGGIMGCLSTKESDLLDLIKIANQGLRTVACEFFIKSQKRGEKNG